MLRGLREHFHKMVASSEKETNRMKLLCFSLFVTKIIAKVKEREIPPSLSILFLYRFLVL